MPPGESLMSSHHFSPPCKRMKTFIHTPHIKTRYTHTTFYINLFSRHHHDFLFFFVKQRKIGNCLNDFFPYTYSLNAPFPLRTNKPTKTKFLIGNFQYTYIKGMEHSGNSKVSSTFKHNNYKSMMCNICTKLTIFMEGKKKVSGKKTWEINLYRRRGWAGITLQVADGLIRVVCGCFGTGGNGVKVH